MGPTGIARRIFGHDARAPWVVAAAVAFLLIPVPGPLLDAVLVSSFGAAALHLATAVDPPARRTAAGFGTLTTGLVLLRTALAFGLTRRVLSGEPADGLAAALGTSLSPFGPIAGLAVLGALALVHLLVVARGVERAAQVAARFALDALPGRQLALESAGRTGEADPETLRRRRAALAADAAEAGAMDGAARFLRGEATAILALALLNALAGLALPVLGGDVPLADAWRAPLAVAAGAGLATLLPALLSGLAVGVFLARHRASEGEGEGDLGESLAGPAPAWAGAAACALVGALPGTPVVSTAAATAAFVALALRRGARSMPAAAEDPSAAGGAAAVVALHPGAMAALGPGGVDRVVDDVRAGLMRRHGLVLPVVNARTAPELPESGYVIEVMGTPVARGRLRAGAGLSLTAPPDALERHPTLGLPAAWTADGPLTPVAVLTLALEGALRRVPGAVLSVDAVAGRLADERRVAPARVAAVCPARVDLAGLTRLLAALLAEDLPIAPLGRLLEALARAPAEALATEDARLRTLRVALADTTSARYAPQGTLAVLCVDGQLEEHLVRTGVLTPGQNEAVCEGLELHLRAEPTLVVLVAPETRSSWARLLHARFPGLPVLSAEDLRSDVRVRPVGLLGP